MLCYLRKSEIGKNLWILIILYVGFKRKFLFYLTNIENISIQISSMVWNYKRICWWEWSYHFDILSVISFLSIRCKVSLHHSHINKHSYLHNKGVSSMAPTTVSPTIIDAETTLQSKGYCKNHKPDICCMFCHF